MMPPLFVCHSHLRWDWVYQRPQHLLSRLARHAPVIVEEEPVFDDRPPGLDALHVAPGVTVLRPHRRAGSDLDLGALVEAYVAAVRGDRPLVRWFYSPMFAPYGDRLGPGQVVVYDCMDELALFKDAPAGLVDAEDRLLARADVVFTGGRSLYEAKAGRNPNVHCFPSAVEADHFARALDPATARPRRPGRPAPAGPRLLRRRRRAARLRPDRPPGRGPGRRLGRPGRPGHQGRPGRAAEAPEAALPRPARATPSCPAT